MNESIEINRIHKNIKKTKDSQYRRKKIFCGQSLSGKEEYFQMWMI